MAAKKPTTPKKSPTNTAIATKEKPGAIQSNPQFKQFLEKNLATIGQVAMKKYCTPDKMLRVALVARSQVPRLAECSGVSFLSALMQSAQLGLYPNTYHQHAALVPYRNKNTGEYECQFQIMTKGMVELGRRFGDLKRCWDGIVYSEDDFEVNLGLRRDMIHKPTLEDDRGEITHVYAALELTGGDLDFEVMTKREVDRIRAIAKSTDGPWRDHWDRMAAKTVVKRLMRRQRLSDETAEALSIDDGLELKGGADLVAFNVPGEEPAALVGDRSAQLAAKISSKAAPTRATPEAVDPDTGEVSRLSDDEMAELNAIAGKDVD